MSYTGVLNKLTKFWLKHGVIIPGYDIRKGAGTLNLNLLKLIKQNKPGCFFSIEKCARPDDGIGILEGCRLFIHTQFQVFIISNQEISMDIFYKCLKYLKMPEIYIELIPSNWNHFILGAQGKGWEANFSGMEFCQITEFDTLGGEKLQLYVYEYAFGIERIVMALDNILNIKDSKFYKNLEFTKLIEQSENDYFYQDNIFDEYKQILDKHLTCLNILIEKNNFWTAAEEIIYCSHLINQLNPFLDNLTITNLKKDLQQKFNLCFHNI